MKYLMTIFIVLLLPLTATAQQPVPKDQNVLKASFVNEPVEQEAAADQAGMLSGSEDLLDSGAEVPVSETDAIRAESILESARSLFTTGGPVVILLFFMSLIALAIVLVKLLQFQRARLWQQKPAHNALALWQQGRVEEALNIADVTANPTAQALARAIRGQRRQLPEVAVREEVLRYGSNILFQLRSGLRPLEVIGSLAPLLGLLGTVMGMISAFQQLEAAGNKVNPAILSGGIWEALLTTAVGLCVAIPVVAVLNWLERRVDHLAHEMDNLVTQVFTEDLSAESEHKPAPLDVTSTINKPSTISAKPPANAKAV